MTTERNRTARSVYVVAMGVGVLLTICSLISSPSFYAGNDIVTIQAQTFGVESSWSLIPSAFAFRGLTIYKSRIYSSKNNMKICHKNKKFKNYENGMTPRNVGGTVATFGRFSLPSAPTTRLSMVSIGLGPVDKDRTTPTGEDGERELVAGIDYEIPNHEEYRTSRRSKTDEQCDQWFEKLLRGGVGSEAAVKGASVSFGCLEGVVASNVLEKLLAQVELVNDIEKKDTSDEGWTPYVTTRLPWTPLVPSYGLEQFGLPIVRRNSEQWRNFDVSGLISVDYSSSITTTEAETDMSRIKKLLQEKGVWLNDDNCSARLVYLNGQFCEKLSLCSSEACTLKPEHLEDPTVVKYLQRLTDGFTDELVHPVDVDNELVPLTSFQKLSSPNHNVGPPTSQFAINTQQGTAAFAALNTIKCKDVAFVHLKESTATDEEDVSPAPVVSIINVVSKHFNIDIDDDNYQPTSTIMDDVMTVKGTSIHPRLLVIAEPNSKLSLLQNCVDLDDSTDNEHVARHTPKLINSYSQIFLDVNANVSHTYINEYGGDYYYDNNDGNDEEYVDQSKDNYDDKLTNEVDDINRKRPELQDTVFETIDVHVNGGTYSGTNVILSSVGRMKLGHSITLLKEGSACTLNGLSVAGTGTKNDIKTNIHHIGSACTSAQLQKNLLGGRFVTTAFRGRIRVEQSAQQTDSQQLSRTVLLSDKAARAWNVPSLEIIADDVKCTHGATVSDLSEEEVFYLRSRGVDPLMARNLLMYAFCQDAITSAVVPSSSNESGPALPVRISRRLDQLVPRGPRAIRGEYQSI